MIPRRIYRYFALALSLVAGAARRRIAIDDPFGTPAEGDNRIASGEIEITATVHVIFRLKSTEFE